MFELYFALGLLLAPPLPAIAQEVPVVSLTSTTTIEDYIASAAIENNYSPKRSVAIARCEGGIDGKVRYNASSTASGAYQFLNSTFQTYCVDKYHLATSSDMKNDIRTQITCANQMLGEGGESHWQTSRWCWDK